MRRREFIALLGGVPLAWPLAGRAQSSGKVHRIGVLRVGEPPPSYIQPFRQALSRLGYVDGQNIIIEYGLAQSVEQLPDVAAELIRRKVDVVLASGTPSVVPARNATSTIPVVFVGAIDPKATGVVASLARPGENVTGISGLFADLTGKRLELLKEILPSLSRVVFLSRAANPGHADYAREAELAAQALHVQLQVILVSTPNDFEEAFRRAREANAILQLDDAMFTSERVRLIELAAAHRLPVVYGPRDFVELGGLLALGPNYSDLYRRAATYVDKILKGAKPGDLPIEQPPTFELVINLKTARALGLSIPPAVLARADEVIE
jgi:putative tryptophan/tyrosine transport system substrate-binding protein